MISPMFLSTTTWPRQGFLCSGGDLWATHLLHLLKKVLLMNWLTLQGLTHIAIAASCLRSIPAKGQSLIWLRRRLVGVSNLRQGVTGALPSMNRLEVLLPRLPRFPRPRKAGSVSIGWFAHLTVEDLSIQRPLPPKWSRALSLACLLLCTGRLLLKMAVWNRE